MRSIFSWTIVLAAGLLLAACQQLSPSPVLPTDATRPSTIIVVTATPTVPSSTATIESAAVTASPTPVPVPIDVGVLIFTPSADTYVDSALPDENFGAVEELPVGITFVGSDSDEATEEATAEATSEPDTPIE